MTERLRLLFVVGSLDPGGAERQTLALVQGLGNRGHHCELISIKTASGSIGRHGSAVLSGGRAYGIGARRFLDLRATGELKRRIIAARPNVVVAVNPYALMYATFARMLSGHRCRIVVNFHSTQLLGLKEALQMAAYRPLFWAASCTVFVCRTQRSYWRRRALASRHCAVIYNGIDTVSYRMADSAACGPVRRRDLGIHPDDYVIGISAWLRPEKNHVQLVEAVAALRDHGVAVQLVVIGDGEMRSAVESRARSHGLLDRVHITGAVEDVRPYVAMCDVIALCSVAVETFSLAALEAMAMEKPVVHAALGGSAEMIVPGENGFLFPVRDTQALVDKLLLLTDRSMRERMGKNARRVVDECFSDKKMVRAYDELLSKLACENRRLPNTVP